MATVEEQYAQRQADNQATYNARQAENQATYDARQAEAQNTYNQRQAEAENTYNQRLNEGNTQIKDMMGKSLESQKAQYNTMLQQGIAAQEEARANIAKTFQTGANDLAVQYERNRRNLNAQALARGLNTGTASQQQLALNQSNMNAYGKLRGEEGAQNAGIDRAIANLKIDTENKIAQAMAENDYKTAAMLFENYNNQISRLDSMQLANRNYLDTQVANNRNYLDSMKMNNQNRLDTVSDRNLNWRDSMTAAQAQTLASYGIFSGYENLGYDSNTINSMKEIWVAQNPLLAYNTGAIDANRFKAITGEYPPGYEAPSSSGGGGGGYGGGPSYGNAYDYNAVKETYDKLKYSGDLTKAGNAVGAARADGLISAQEAYNITTGRDQGYTVQNSNQVPKGSGPSLKEMVVARDPSIASRIKGA